MEEFPQQVISLCTMQKKSENKLQISAHLFQNYDERNPSLTLWSSCWHGNL